MDAYTRHALPGVAVAIQDLSLLLSTDADGTFQILDIPVGVYELRLSAPGYRDAIGDFAIMRSGSFTTTLTPIGAFGEPPRGRLVGRVTEEGGVSPVQGVLVEVRDVFLEGLTGEDGRFAFDGVPPGRHQVAFSNLGYATRVDTIEVVAGLTSDARVTLAIDAVEIEPVDVVVERREVVLEQRGFYERKRLTTGDFIDREAIENQRPVEITDLFTRLNGVEIRMADPLNPSTRSIVLRGGRRELSRCYPSVYVDGVQVHRGGNVPAMLNQLVSPDQVAGIEVYQGGASVPVEYGGSSGACGVIVVWTRG